MGKILLNIYLYREFIIVIRKKQGGGE